MVLDLIFVGFDFDGFNQQTIYLCTVNPKVVYLVRCRDSYTNHLIHICEYRYCFMNVDFVKNLHLWFFISYQFQIPKMAAEEAEAAIVIEGGVMGVKKATRFSPLVNFKFEILYFMENIDIGNFLSILICSDNMAKSL